jgi:tetratricopeptide (TPR) repeat protein
VPVVPATPDPAGSNLPIAVLPFERDALGFQRLHYAWAIHDLLTRELSRNSRLVARSTGSVARAMIEVGGNTDSAAKLLRVRHFITGRITTVRGRQEITVALRTVGRTDTTWRASYGDDWTIPRIIAAINRGALRAVRIPEAPATPSPLVSDGLLEAMAEGDYYLLSSTLAGADSARIVYEAALPLGPVAAPLQARLARTYVLILERGGSVPRMTTVAALARAEELAQRAVRFDSLLADAWTAQAVVSRFRDPIRFRGAIEAHARAVSQPGRSADAEHEYGVTLMRLGSDRTAEQHLRRALAIEPNRAPTLAALAELALRNQRWAESCGLGNASIAVWPYDPVAYAARARARLWLSQERDAYADVETAARFTAAPWASALRVLVDVRVNAVAAARGNAQALAVRWLAPGRMHAVRDATHLAMAFLGVGDNRRAVEALRRASPLGADFVTAMRDPALTALRADTTVRRLLRQASGEP